jgi:hypothetical protein
MWFFRKKRPGEKIRNPIQGEFFATEAIEGPAQALVRESVQNSLDAASGTGPVRVRILLADGEHALPADRVAGLFDGAWPHFAAPGNGLRDAPLPGAPCSFLVVEDFGTRGLTGDPAQADPEPDAVNPFFLFFRAEGLSAKSGTELGRWGVGKFVFPRSSRASAHFGLTVRHDDGRRLLLGAVTLKAHRVADDTAMYTPDGLFGVLHGEDFVLPIENAAAIDRFGQLFRLKRTTEPGLSVVVPFVDTEITFDSLLVAAVRDWFLPVIAGRLEIEIETAASRTLLSSATLDEAVGTHSAALGPAIRGHVELARRAAAIDHSDRILLNAPDPGRAPRWSDALVPEPALTHLRQRLAARSHVAVRVPVTVRSKTNGPLQSHFDIHLAHDRNSDGRPLFVREGIIISDVRGPRAREMHSMVVIEDRPLAALLGDSENPAHTQWQKDSSNFRGRYTYGPSMIEFVTRSVGELLSVVNRSSEQADPSLTVDFFSIEPPEDTEDDGEETERTRPRPQRGDDGGGGPTVNVEPRPTKLRIRRSPGGFSVQPGSGPPSPPYLVEVRCAYDVRRGNALGKWDPADFKLGSSQTPVACEGDVGVHSVRGNWLLLQVTGPEFRATVTGFDVARDIYVRADIRELSNDGTTT